MVARKLATFNQTPASNSSPTEAFANSSSRFVLIDSNMSSELVMSSGENVLVWKTVRDVSSFRFASSALRTSEFWTKSFHANPLGLGHSCMFHMPFTVLDSLSQGTSASIARPTLVFAFFEASFQCFEEIAKSSLAESASVYIL